MQSERETSTDKTEGAEDPAEVMHQLRRQILDAIGASGVGDSIGPSQYEQVDAAIVSPVAGSESRAWRELRHKLYLVSESHLVRETPFESHLPLIGPLIAAFRQAWNSVACKWHVRKLMVQQNAFNLATLQALRALMTVAEQQQQMLHKQERQIAALRGDVPGMAGPAMSGLGVENEDGE